MNKPASDIFPVMLVRTAGLPLQGPAGSITEFSTGISDFLQAKQIMQQTLNAATTVFEAEKEMLLEDQALQKNMTNTRRVLRKSTGEIPIKIEPYFREKRPDLASTLDQLNIAIAHQQSAFQLFQQRYQSMVWAEKNAIQSYATHPTIQRALLFSSHSLFQQLPAFSRISPEEWHKKERKTADSLLKYVFRAATKTTPLSRLATVSMQRLSHQRDASDLLEGFFDAAKHIVTPNVALLPAIYNVLLQEPAFYHSLSLCINPSLNTTQEGYEWLFYNGEQESFQQLPASAALETVVAVFRKTPQNSCFSELWPILCQALDADTASVEKYVFQLIDFGMLEWILPEKGLTPGWCGSLYNILGFLPSAPLLTDTAFLLQWLRTAARTIPFQALEEAMTTQISALEECRHYFEKYGGVCPDIAPEQIFYEDVEYPVQGNVPLEVVEQVADQIASCLKNATTYEISGLRAQIMHFGAKILPLGESVPFLDFCKLFLTDQTPNKSNLRVEMPLPAGKIGALLQFYTTDSGEYRAVLNGLFPGGGKMMARWQHLFPTDLKEQMQKWWPEEVLAFAWQDWSNANFQPVLSRESVQVPGGRVGGHTPDAGIRLSDVWVHQTKHGLELRDPSSGRRVVFSDLGLEQSASRPPVIQILWQLGVPYISASILTGKEDWTTLESGIFFKKRLEYQSIIINRAAWMLGEKAWRKYWFEEVWSDEKQFLLLRETLAGWGVPRRFFASINEETSRYFDQDSPLLMQSFWHMLSGSTGSLYLSEMLPTPDQWIANADQTRRAAEWVLEIQYS